MSDDGCYLSHIKIDIHHIAINLDLTDLECGEILNSPSFWMVVHDLESSNVAALFSVLWNLSGQDWRRSPNIHNVMGKFPPPQLVWFVLFLRHFLASCHFEKYTNLRVDLICGFQMFSSLVTQFLCSSSFSPLNLNLLSNL